ncbi:hypothetical protein [Flavobacterium branchiophilum]|uniref:DUF1871 domain-containing protein n=1 Tax=Flavobacterium branchiophilum TaxID=55197 RepID=A0A2H3KB01_9FLAO|nr:hypothetical protein [Flavobacterium branchiophilum]PDS24019.1 hypothetical protein B0A77_09355 [Flavobacterium branchiophilum]
MKNIIKGINQILAEWDPLDLGGDISSDEYQSYVPQIMKHIKNEKSLTYCLEQIFINNLETGYDRNNDEHKKKLAAVVEKIIKLQT